MKGKDLTERVYKEMKKDIMLGNIPSNELFSEQMLSDRYNCSRTPAREAAGQLVMEGFLNKYPSKGYIIHLPTMRELRDMRHCRYVLESAGLEQIVRTAYTEDIRKLYPLASPPETDSEEAIFSNMIFHLELMKLCDNQTLLNLVERLHCLMMRNDVEQNQMPVYDYLGITHPQIKASPNPLLDEPNNHKALLDAILERDIKKAKRMLQLDIYPGYLCDDSTNSKG